MCCCSAEGVRFVCHCKCLQSVFLANHDDVLDAEVHNELDDEEEDDDGDDDVAASAAVADGRSGGATSKHISQLLRFPFTQTNAHPIPMFSDIFIRQLPVLATAFIRHVCVGAVSRTHPQRFNHLKQTLLDLVESIASK